MVDGTDKGKFGKIRTNMTKRLNMALGGHFEQSDQKVAYCSQMARSANSVFAKKVQKKCKQSNEKSSTYR